MGLWLEQNEGAKFWLRVMNELKNRGVEDILLAVVDGLKGFPDAITAVFPEAIDLNPGNWSEFGEKFSVRFGHWQPEDFCHEEVEVQRAADCVYSEAV